MSSAVLHAARKVRGRPGGLTDEMAQTFTETALVRRGDAAPAGPAARAVAMTK
ncbi:MAG TPA: hypothetical protein VF170_03695 [Planctomycetaceae bacterium]